MQLDQKAQDFIVKAKASGKSKEDTMKFLQSKGYDLQTTESKTGGYKGAVNKPLSFISGLAQGASFGLADEIAGALDPTKTIEDYREFTEQQQEEYPKTALLGDITGGVTQAVGAGLAGAGKYIGAGLLPKVGLSAGIGTGEGFARGEGIEDRLKGGLTTGAISAAFPIVGKGVKKVLPFGVKGKVAEKVDKVLKATDGSVEFEDVIEAPAGVKALKNALRVDDDVAEQIKRRATDQYKKPSSRTGRISQELTKERKIYKGFEEVKDLGDDLYDNEVIKKALKEANNPIYGVKGQPDSSFAKAQAVKEVLDDDISSAFTQGKSRVGSRLSEVRDDLVNKMEDKVSGYKEARGRYSQLLGRQDEVSKRMKKLASMGETQITKPDRQLGALLREAFESVGSIAGSAADLASLKTGSRVRKGVADVLLGNKPIPSNIDKNALLKALLIQSRIKGE